MKQICTGIALLLLTLCAPCYAAKALTMPSSSELKIASFTNATVENLQYSTYRLGGKHFDPNKGVYVLDCSSYVDHILKSACPIAYHRLVNNSGNLEPTSRDYYEFFKSLPKNNPQRAWNKVENVKALHPGDIMVFRFGNARRAVPGHVMVVMNKPIPKIKTSQVSTFTVRVADSASVRHSKDTRAINDSGVGIGTMLLKANASTGKPYAYAWQVGSHWEHVNIAMARPIDNHVLKTKTVITTVKTKPKKIRSNRIRHFAKVHIKKTTVKTKIHLAVKKNISHKHYARAKRKIVISHSLRNDAEA